MDQQKYELLVSRLEGKAVENRNKYLASVIAVALLGFLILGVALFFSLLAALLLVGIVLLVVFSGGKLLLFLGGLGKLVLLLALPAWTMVKSSLTILFSRFPAPTGRELSRNEAPALFARLDELRSRMAGPPIHKVLLRDELNAAIVQQPRFGLIGWEENYLILGLRLLCSLTENEALSVVAHEYGHLSGHHSRLGGIIYRFRAAWGRIQQLSEQWDDLGSRLMARLLGWYAPYFNAYTFVLARQTEYIADRTAVEIAGRTDTAQALMRLIMLDGFELEIFWPAINRLVADAPQPPASRYSLWAQSLRTQLDESSCSRFLQAAGQRTTDHLDTHPSLSDRLAALGSGIGDGSARGLLESLTVTAAEAWLGASLPTIQAEFDAVWREDIAEDWHTRHSYLLERRTRFAELDALSNPDVAQQWERIRIIEDLQLKYDLLPLLNRVLASDAGHLEARYRRGALLLRRNDESGIADLEFAMARDADAILGGCELAWKFYELRNPELARRYLERWKERTAHQQRVQTELASLKGDATLARAELDEESLEAIRAILRRAGKHIRKAYILRRILKIDNSVGDHVLAFETSWFSIGDRGAQTVRRLAGEEYPQRMFIVHLGSPTFKRFRKSIKRLGIEPIEW